MPADRSFNVARNRGSRRSLLTLGAVTAGTLAAGLTGCSSSGSGGADDRLKKKIDNPGDNVKTSGFPIVKDRIDLQFMTGRFGQNAKDFNKVANWKKYQQLTNVTIDWGLVPFDSRDEKRNLALSGDDYPEAFNTMDFSGRDVGKYGRQGQFVKLNDLIDTYMPNLKHLMDGNDVVRRGLKFPDGGIYGMPTVIDPKFTGMLVAWKPYVRGDWLDKFDMDVPTTTDEYHRYLKMVKKKHPNGHGQTVPYCDQFSAAALRVGLMGSFGVGNRGATQAYIDAQPDDEDTVRFYRINDDYKALLEFLHRLYSSGLIAKNIFSTDQAKVSRAAAEGTYGSMMIQSPDYEYNAKNFVPVPALKGPDGHHAYNNVNSSLLDVGGFVITDKCKHPVAAARWMDYFYSDEGIKLFFMGVEGKSYKKTADGPQWLDKITHPAKGVTQNEAKNPYVTYMGSGYAGVFKQEFFAGSEDSPQSVRAAKLLEPDIQRDVWPNFTFTREESEQIDSLADDIEKYVDESADKFITGDLKLSDWDKYVEKIKKMGLDDYMKIQQAAYDRYRKQ